MAQVSFDVANEIEASRPQQGGNFEFFSLRNDGDEAIVRFKYDNTSQFQIYTVHDVDIEANNRRVRRKVSCLRNPTDPIDRCPFCASGKNSRNIFLIEMIQYVTDVSTNTIISKPVVWERSMVYANRLKSLLDEYGPLSDCIFKIKRCGAAGSMDTTYEIYYGNPKMYPDEVFLKDFSIFNEIKFMGTVILDKNYDEISYYLRTGNFPAVQRSENSQQVNNVENMTTYTQPSTPQYVPKNQEVEYNKVPQPVQNPVNNLSQSNMTPPQRQEYIPVNNPPPARQYEPTQQSENRPPQRATRYY